MRKGGAFTTNTLTYFPLRAVVLGGWGTATVIVIMSSGTGLFG